MRVDKREIENAIQELNDVIMDFAIYQDSLRSVRDTLEKLIKEPEPEEKVKCGDCKNCKTDKNGNFFCRIKECTVDILVEEECHGYESDDYNE